MPVPKVTRGRSFASAAKAVTPKPTTKTPAVVADNDEETLSPRLAEAAAPKPKKIPPGSRARLQIPVIDRANYVAYLRIALAIEQLRYVPLMAQGVDRIMLESLIRQLNVLLEGPYAAIGMDKEHIEGLTNAERFPEDRELIDRRQLAKAAPNAKPSQQR